MANEYSLDGKWTKGVNSVLDASFLQPGEFSWAINVDNSGGILQTRQGYSKIRGLELFESSPSPARGITIFTPKSGVPSIIIARGAQILSSQYPFESAFTQLPGASWRNTLGPVTFVQAIRNAKYDEDGNKVIIDPYPVLIIQDGEGRAMVWDGTTLVESNPADRGIPIGLWGQFTGGRYWVSSGSRLYASDLGEPLSFREQEGVADGGFYNLPGTVTGMGQTPDFRNLIVFTDSTTTSFQTGIIKRADWANTTDFQKVIIPGIGCAAGKSVINQYGITWWYSHQGLIGLDQALQTYRTSRIGFRDTQMARSKGNLASDIAGICCGTFGNYLAVSVPSGDAQNAHTWVLNEAVVPTEQEGGWTGAWTGTRPVQWVTAVIKGQNRCFFISNDYGVGNSGFDGPIPYYTNVWEAFIGDRIDANVDAGRRIPCLVETRGLAATDEFKEFQWAELDLSELQGSVHLEVYYAGRKGGYKKILDKQISASQGSFGGPDSVTAQTVTTSDVTFYPLSTGPLPTTTMNVTSTAGFTTSGRLYIAGRVTSYTGKTATTFTGVGFASSLNGVVQSGAQVTQKILHYDPDGDSDIFTSYRPQRRTVRTTSVEPATDCSSCSVESDRTDNIDRVFFLLIKWTGKMALNGIRVCYTKENIEQAGKCEENEIEARYVTDLGCGAVADGVNQDETYSFGAQHSQFVQIITPRNIEEPYSSFIPQ